MLDIFEILGPIMVGPSSSHTAGAVRIGRMARTLLGEPPVKADIGLYGSFAETGRGHGTDRALVAGLLGMKPDDLRIPESFSVAKEQGLSFVFHPAELREAHPNTAVLTVEGASGKKTKVQAASIGGGRIRVDQLDGVAVDFTGIFNTLMSNAGVTDFLKTIGLLGQNMNHIPFLTDQHWAKFMIILINIWVGVPYQMIIATGVLMNIPSDMLEASTIDGASPWQSFIHIKLPYLFSVQGPALVTDFVKNVNNFNVIYLLTQDVYITKDQALASSSAKEVDLLVTWLFRLTQEQYNYKMAAVIGIMVFIICAVFTLVCFRFLNKKEATFS